MKFYLLYDGKAHTYSQYAWIYRRVLGHFRRGVVWLINILAFGSTFFDVSVSPHKNEFSNLYPSLHFNKYFLFFFEKPDFLHWKVDFMWLFTWKTKRFRVFLHGVEKIMKAWQHQIKQNFQWESCVSSVHMTCILVVPSPYIILVYSPFDFSSTIYVVPTYFWILTWQQLHGMGQDEWIQNVNKQLKI